MAGRSKQGKANVGKKTRGRPMVVQAGLRRRAATSRPDVAETVL